MLATANLLAIRRLLSRSIALTYTNSNPGPPLAPSHPSPSLLAKLNLHVYALLDSARALCKAAHKSSAFAAGEASPALRRVLSDGRALAQARSFKWLGVDCGENGGRAKAGEAVGWLVLAKDVLDEVAAKGEGLNRLKLNKGKKVGQAGRDAVVREAESVAVFLHAYKMVNDTVSSPGRPEQFSSGADRGLTVTFGRPLAAPLPARLPGHPAAAGRARRARGPRGQGVHPPAPGVQAALAVRPGPALARPRRGRVRGTRPGRRQRRRRARGRLLWPGRVLLSPSPAPLVGLDRRAGGLGEVGGRGRSSICCHGSRTIE